MAAAVTNPYSITWGSFECGGTTERLITGLHRLRRDHAAFEITFDVVIRGTSDSDFATNCASIESEFSKRRQLILVKVGASTIHTFNPASGTNTGLNSYARIEKSGTTGADTDRSRLYTVTVGCGLPSTDTSGRRDSSVTVDYTPAQRRIVTIAGFWTAITSNGAMAQYTAQIDAYCASVLSGLSPAATFEEVNGLGQFQRDDQDQTLTFSRVYSEVSSNQPGASPDSASIVRHEFKMKRVRTYPGDSRQNVRRLDTVVLTFSCWIDKTVTTDIDALYTGTVRDWMLGQMRSEFGTSTYGVQVEDYDYDPVNHRLDVTMSVLAAINATRVSAVSLTASVRDIPNMVLTGEWNGSEFAYHADKGIATRLRTARRVQTKVGYFYTPETRSQSNGSALYREMDPNASGGTWVLIDSDSSRNVQGIGRPGDHQLIVTQMVDETLEQFIVTPGATTSVAPVVTETAQEPGADTGQSGAPPGAPTTGPAVGDNV